MNMATVDKTGSYNLSALQTPTILLTSALHDLAQPLTVLAALLDEAGQGLQPTLEGEHLAMARGECHRAIAAVRNLQALPSLGCANGGVKGAL